MTNLEWFNEIGMIAENEVWTETSDLKGQIGVNLVIALRDDDFKKYSEKGFGWLLEEHREPIKLKQWEFELIGYIYRASSVKKMFFVHYSELNHLRGVGYFKGITNEYMTLKEILDNCEVIENE